MRNNEKIAMSLLKNYKLKSTLIFDNLNLNGKYDVDTDTIYIHKSLYEEDFLMTIFHEINHAIYCRDMGVDDYKKDYELEMERCIISDLNPYKDNFYEKEAEHFAMKQTSLYLQKHKGVI